MGALGGGRDHQFRRRDYFVAGRMMLADPCLVEADLVEMFDQVDIAAQCERRIFVDGMKRREEDSGAQAVGSNG